MIDEKELLELAKQSAPLEPRKEDIDPNVDQFMLDVGIQEDTNSCIPLRFIHWRYVKWCDVKGIKPMVIGVFGKEIRKRFRHRKAAVEMTYFVNKEPFKIDNEEIWLLRAYYRKVKENGKKKKNKRKTSRTNKSIQQQS